MQENGVIKKGPQPHNVNYFGRALGVEEPVAAYLDEADVKNFTALSSRCCNADQAHIPVHRSCRVLGPNARPKHDTHSGTHRSEEWRGILY
ncbi:MAG: hypothetical protein COX83_04045 [Candidatus Magasanikbacteria bacterium CG_4_10_14_0_2_um_filter_41_31]|uniref:Uncharacterized protein n=1 Tax=Candidatus Magasanikbacteria bacterium CG_4_10_14_0_2_um_filter_41_31 TaxID=1974639 RepID=A0A2M7V282_9BACT|nr:MAG: hypothetical protein COX83_04045 [Candidatus Magasanikbacteria bacterium CG_4_10_14_0_2_um_filter_41_31]